MKLIDYTPFVLSRIGLTDAANSGMVNARKSGVGGWEIK